MINSYERLLYGPWKFWGSKSGSVLNILAGAGLWVAHEVPGQLTGVDLDHQNDRL